MPSRWQYRSHISCIDCSIFFAAALFVLGCAADEPSAELVLRSGTTLIAKTHMGDLSIHAGDQLAREYGWGGCSLSANMRKRDSRWLGSLGIYDPAGSFGILSALFPWWFKCNGVSRTVVEEGQLHFSNERDAEKWLARYSQSASTVWSNDGLVVQWGIDPRREQINVNLWQLCVTGRRPAGLVGSSDYALLLKSNGQPNTDRYECSGVGPNVPAETQREWNDLWNRR